MNSTDNVDGDMCEWRQLDLRFSIQMDRWEEEESLLGLSLSIPFYPVFLPKINGKAVRIVDSEGTEELLQRELSMAISFLSVLCDFSLDCRMVIEENVYAEYSY